MLLVVLLLQVLLFALLVVLLLRKPTAQLSDARLAQVPDQVVAVLARIDGMEATLRAGVAELRRESADAALQARAAADAASRGLREEVAGSIHLLGETLSSGLNGFRTDNEQSAEYLRAAVGRELGQMLERMTAFSADAGRQAAETRTALQQALAEMAARQAAAHEAMREGMQRSLAELGTAQHDHQERLRASMQERLDRLNTDNSAKLEEMRATVDEKLNATLNDRLTHSFGQVTTHLGEVQRGLGEMRELATGVSDLKKVFSNVKARGVVGEFQLGMQLEQMFSRDQYAQNVAIKPGSAERVEYALRIPHPHGEKLFAIDSKFPREDWERLELAYETGSAEEIQKAGSAFERAVRTEGKRICEKYIHEPVTLPHAILFLPTESLFAEVMRRPGLQSDIQQGCNVTIAGPSTLMAILTSFRMGFHSIALEKKGNEVWKVLGGVKTEFGKFGEMMNKVERQVGTVQNTLGEIAGKTRTINRNLRNVTEMESGEDESLLAFEELAGHLPLVAAESN